MNLSNSQIRERARVLLDDNIFGKNWLKSIVVTLIMTGIIGCSSGVLVTLSNMFLLPILLKYLGGISVIFLYGIPILLDVIELLVLNILIGPLSVGIASVHLDLVEGNGDIKIRKFFKGFDNFFDNFQIGFMYLLHTFIWTCVFIIPGIYVAYTYAMVFYVKHDNPEFRWQQCVDESERLMEGNRWRLFKLQLSFIGWYIVGALTCGIGTYWVSSYQQVSTAVFYEQLKDERGATY